MKGCLRCGTLIGIEWTKSVVQRLALSVRENRKAKLSRGPIHYSTSYKDTNVMDALLAIVVDKNP